MKIKQECAGCGKVKRKNSKRFVKIKTLRKRFFITNPGLNDYDRVCSKCADSLTKPFIVK